MNIADLFQFFANFLFLTTSLLDLQLLEDNKQRATSSFIMVIMWLKMFDWLRMFDNASKYVSLIYQTIADILPFFGIFLILLYTFGSAMFILDSKSGAQDVIGKYVENDYVNMMINQYLLSLGEYD